MGVPPFCWCRRRGCQENKAIVIWWRRSKKRDSITEHINQKPCMYPWIWPSRMHPLCEVCLHILVLGSVLFALAIIIFVGSFHALVTIHEPEQLTTCYLTGVSVPGRQNPPQEEQMSLNFGAVRSFLKQRQNEELGKDNYKDKCQEVQDFVTNEVFRSSGTSVHKSSALACLSWIWQPGLLGSLKSEATLGTENLAAFSCFFPI